MRDGSSRSGIGWMWTCLLSLPGAFFQLMAPLPTAGDELLPPQDGRFLRLIVGWRQLQ